MSTRKSTSVNENISNAIPTIYLNNEDEGQTAAQLRNACTHVGFFYLEQHGVSSELLSRVLTASTELFSLPLDEKVKLMDSVLNRGYTQMGEEKLDPQNQPTKGDTKEGYYLGKDVPIASPMYNPAKLSGPNVWPTPETCPSWTQSQCKQFETTMKQYFDVMSSVGLKVVQLLALAIGLPTKHFFDDAFADPMALLRLLHYSSAPSCPSKGIYGCGAHSDYGMITLLLTDKHRGLQILTKESQWVDVPPRNGAFIVNLGDMLERWTNGLFRSTIHRVIIPVSTESCGKKADRYSIPFFYEPNFDTVVKCLDVCCPNGEPKYLPATSGRHLLEKYAQTHADFSPFP